MIEQSKDRKFHTDARCSYQCQYYMDGPVLSICRKYGNEQLHYDGSIPPLRCDKCIQDK